MFQLMQLLKGYVQIRVSGYSTERFINLCGNHDILLWNIHYDSEYATMNISVKGFFQCKQILKKTGTKAVIIKKSGLPFFIAACSKQKMFVFGLCAAILFWTLISGCIWKIELIGNYSITDDVLLDYLRENRVYVGMHKKDLDIEMLEKHLREKYELITWTSAKIDGTTLVVQLKENENVMYELSVDHSLSTGDADEKNGVDILSTVDGKIASIITRSGVPLVKPGDLVEKGDILVSGAIPVMNEDATVRKYDFCIADADIEIEYETQTLLEQRTEYNKKIYTGNSRKWFVIGSQSKEWSIPYVKIPYEHYDISEDKSDITLLDQLQLPIYYGEKKANEYCVDKNRYNDEEMRILLQNSWDKLLITFKEKGVQIIQKNVKINKYSEKWVLSANLLVRENAIEKKNTATNQINTDMPEQD